MAITFELWTECDGERSTAEFCRHFEGLRTTLHDGREVNWNVNPEQDSESSNAVSVWTHELGYYIGSPQDARNFTEAALLLYEHLITAPAFRLARVDFEACNVSIAELKHFICINGDGQRELPIQCVVDESVYDSLERPIQFSNFRPGYWWIPYNGHSYTPIYHELHLIELRKKLFPDGRT